jgi:S1-C subfamily serine protease
VVEVVDRSPAAVAGLRPEDLILGLDDAPVEGVNDLQRLMSGELIGRTVTASIVRQGRELRVPLVPAELES